MTALNQIIAIEKGVKSRAYSQLSEINKIIQKSELFNGFFKSYHPKDETGDELPSEKKTIQMNCKDILENLYEIMDKYFMITAIKDWTNCKAKADIIINTQVLIPQVPVTYLLFLEKQLNDLKTLISNLPVLDSSEHWNKDENSGIYKTELVKTHRTQKIQEGLVLYPATSQHPAQTQLITKDIIVGHWHTTKQSGAMSSINKKRILDNIESLIIAVKLAREKANMIEEIEIPDVSKSIFQFIFHETPLTPPSK